jgi:predicted nucleic acid-binding protein
MIVVDTNVLALYIRQQILSLQDAQQIMDEATGLMQGREYQVSSPHILNLAATSTCSAYDCEFVALAQLLDVPLLTVDKQVLDQFPSVAISLDDFATPSQ